MARGRISHFPIDLRRRPYNTLALPCECVLERLQNMDTIRSCLYVCVDISKGVKMQEQAQPGRQERYAYRQSVVVGIMLVVAGVVSIVVGIVATGPSITLIPLAIVCFLSGTLVSIGRICLNK